MSESAPAGRRITQPRGPAPRWRLTAFAVLATVLLHLLALHGLRRGLDQPWDEANRRLDPVQVALLPAVAPRVAEPVTKAAPEPATAPPAQASAVPPPPAASPAASPAGARLLPDEEASAAPAAALDGEEGSGAAPGMAAASEVAGAVSGQEARSALGAAPGTAAEGAPPAEPAAERLPAASPRAAESPMPLYGTALPAPAPARRRFQVHYGDYAQGNVVAELDYALEVEQDRYRLRTEARAVGLTALFWSGALTQASTGRLGGDGLEPERYVEQRGRRPERSTRIDRASGVAVFPAGEQTALVAGVQDRLSMLIQLGLIARAQPQRMVAGRRIEVPELGSRAIAPAVFVSRGDESLATDRGPLRALHLERRDGDPARDPRVDVWLGYDHGLTPVRIRLTDPGGRVLDQVLVP